MKSSDQTENTVRAVLVCTVTKLLTVGEIPNVSFKNRIEIENNRIADAPL